MKAAGRGVLVFTFCGAEHIFQPAQSINFMLAVFEKLYKYAEQPDDRIPI